MADDNKVLKTKVVFMWIFIILPIVAILIWYPVKWIRDGLSKGADTTAQASSGVRAVRTISHSSNSNKFEEKITIGLNSPWRKIERLGFNKWSFHRDPEHRNIVTNRTRLIAMRKDGDNSVIKLSGQADDETWYNESFGTVRFDYMEVRLADNRDGPASIISVLAK